jgi:hypothetical protein
MLKGKTTIELYKDNKLFYRKVETNKVTNAVSNLVNQNYVVNGISNNGGEIATTYAPIWKNFAGLMLFTQNLNEDLIIPDKDAITYFTGNATDAMHYDSNNVYHGKLEANESVIEEDKLDLMFTFPLNSVSGDIGSICLTSISGGNSGLSQGNNSILVSYSDRNLQEDGACGVGIDTPSANYIPYVKTSVDGNIIGINEDGMMVTLKEVDNTTITLTTYQTKKKVGFTDTFYKLNNIQEFENLFGGTIENLPQIKKIKEETITLPNGYQSMKSSIIDQKLYMSNMSDNTYYLYEIDLDTFSIKYQNATLNIDGVFDYRNTGTNLYITTSDYLYVVVLGEYRDNQYLNELTFDRIETLEENLTPLVFKDTVALLNTSNIQNDDIRNIYFLTSTNIFNKNIIKFAGTCDNIINFCFNFNEPVMGVITKTGDVATINTNVFAPYLATINNINVCTKYATVMMKVHYELYQEED